MDQRRRRWRDVGSDQVSGTCGKNRSHHRQQRDADPSRVNPAHPSRTCPTPLRSRSRIQREEAKLNASPTTNRGNIGERREPATKNSDSAFPGIA